MDIIISSKSLKKNDTLISLFDIQQEVAIEKFSKVLGQR